jgi:hypothetical protein
LTETRETKFARSWCAAYDVASKVQVIDTNITPKAHEVDAAVRMVTGESDETDPTDSPVVSLKA